MPNQFVLKCTHDSGGVIICKDKSHFDKEAALNKLKQGLKQNFYWKNREWPYKNVKPRIIAEKYMTDGDDSLKDYKFLCFHGEVKALSIVTERMKDEETKFDFFDENYNHLPFTNGYPNATVLPQKPLCFVEMKKLASELSQGIPHVRVDFYEVNGKVYFGEMTFFPGSGFTPFVPSEWESIMGDWIDVLA